MSKLYSMYLNLKEQNPDYLFLFKSGIFYIAIDKDAIKLSDLLNLKLTNLNNEIKKCGFPCNSLDKYLNLFKACNLPVSIINVEKNTTCSLKQFELNKSTLEIIDMLKNVATDNLSVSEAYSFIETLKEKAVNNS